MEIKAELRNYTEEQRLDFIVEYNHNMGYEIRYTEEEETIEPTEEGEEPQVVVTVKVIQAWGYTEEEEAEQESERIAQLHLTRGDVFRALLLARQVTRAQLRAMIEQMPEETPEQMIAKEYALIDFDESLDFYRGIALLDTLGLALGITEEQMTEFFETNDWHVLIPDSRVQEEPVEEVEDRQEEVEQEENEPLGEE